MLGTISCVFSGLGKLGICQPQVLKVIGLGRSGLVSPGYVPFEEARGLRLSGSWETVLAGVYSCWELSNWCRSEQVRLLMWTNY